jgi:hypothetical protein
VGKIILMFSKFNLNPSLSEKMVSFGSTNLEILVVKQLSLLYLKMIQTSPNSEQIIISSLL